MSEMMHAPDGWEEKKLGEVVKIAIGGTPDRDNSDYWDSQKISHNLWVSIRDLNKKIIDGTEEYISDLGVLNSNVKKIAKGTILMSFKLSIGKLAFADRDLYTNEAIAALTPNGKLDNLYLYYGLHFWDLLAEVDQAVKGATLNIEKIKKIVIFYPQEKKEQEKIVRIFSTLDKTIEATNSIIEKEKNIKKALMQELLINGIDKDGHIRSPQTHTYKESELGLIPEEWEAENIGLLVKNLDSKRIPLKEGDRQEIRGQYPYYGASGIIDWVDDFIFDGEYILLGEDGENVVSRVLPLAFKATGKIWVNNHAHVFQCKKDVNMDYVVNLLESTDYKSIINGSAQPKITQDGLNKLLFKIAPKNEQKQIAKILTTQDKKIETEETSLAKLKELKKGLMNDLLSGKVRVKV